MKGRSRKVTAFFIGETPCSFQDPEGDIPLFLLPATEKEECPRPALQSGKTFVKPVYELINMLLSKDKRGPQFQYVGIATFTAHKHTPLSH